MAVRRSPGDHRQQPVPSLLNSPTNRPLGLQRVNQPQRLPRNHPGTLRIRDEAGFFGSVCEHDELGC
jgi:hypothetical protein